MSVVAVATGAAAGLGVWLVIDAAPWARRPSLAERVRPYVGAGEAAPTDVRASTPFPTLERVFAPAVAAAAARLDRFLGGRNALRARLDQAGDARSTDSFRKQQALTGLVGAAAALVVVGLAGATGSKPAPGAAIVLMVVGTVVGIAAPEQLLDRRIARHRRAIVAELPVTTELLALAVAAGESIGAALDRVGGLSRGALGAELRLAMNDVRAGRPLLEAIAAMAARIDLPPVTRVIDALVVAVERGTPVAEVLRAQARDVRDGGKQALMESAGRREIAMMVPVVFLVLPVTVVFALFPGFFGLSVTV